MDLNRLKIFFVLYQEKNMRRAAERLHSSQPSLSQQLSKLRHQFNDELFVKVPQGLEPTSFADKLYQNSYETFHQLEQSVTQTSDFNPQYIKQTISLAVSPLLAPLLGYRFLKKITEEAPNLTIHIHQWSQHTLELIRSDQIHIGVHYQITSQDKQIREVSIAKDSFRCLIRKDHPIKANVVSMAEAAKYPFTTIISSDWNSKISYAEQAFDALGLKIDIGYRSELPEGILEVVQNTDMIFPCSTLYRFMDQDVYRSFTLEENIPISTPNICTYYHYKNDKDPLTLWLISLFKEVLSSP